MASHQPVAQVVALALGEMWTCRGLASVAEAARVLDLLFEQPQPGGVLLLDAEHIPRAHCLASDGVASIDPAELLAAGWPYGTAAVVLWVGGIDQPAWRDLAALAGLAEAIRERWRVLDVVIRPVSHRARSVRWMQPSPIPNLGGFRMIKPKVSPKLRVVACRVMLDRIGRAELWSAHGPTNAAYEHLAEIKQALPVERVVTLAAWAIWNGRSQLKFSEILALEDQKTAALISGYLVAASYGNDTVNAWLAAKRRRGARN